MVVFVVPNISEQFRRPMGAQRSGNSVKVFFEGLFLLLTLQVCPDLANIHLPAKCQRRTANPRSQVGTKP